MVTLQNTKKGHLINENEYVSNHILREALNVW